MDSHLNLGWNLHPKLLLKKRSWRAYSSRPVLAALVPGGRRSEQRRRVARAERTHDEMMDALIVGNHRKLGRRVRVARLDAELSRRRVAVYEQPKNKCR